MSVSPLEQTKLSTLVNITLVIFTSNPKILAGMFETFCLNFWVKFWQQISRGTCAILTKFLRKHYMRFVSHMPNRITCTQLNIPPLKWFKSTEVARNSKFPIVLLKVRQKCIICIAQDIKFLTFLFLGEGGDEIFPKYC